jgi:hypothetical protein
MKFHILVIYDGILFSQLFLLYMQEKELTCLNMLKRTELSLITHYFLWVMIVVVFTIVASSLITNSLDFHLYQEINNWLMYSFDMFVFRYHL